MLKSVKKNSIKMGDLGFLKFENRCGKSINPQNVIS